MKFYPALVNPRDKGRLWKPHYKTDGYSQITKTRTRVPYTVDEARSYECPVSCVTQPSADMVYLITGMEKLKDYAGATASLGDLAGAMTDAIRVISNESNTIEGARQEAQERNSNA